MDCLDGVFEANIQQRRLENSPHISDTAKTLFSSIVVARSTSQAKQTKPTYRRLPPLLEPDFLRGANVEAGVVGAKDI